MTSGWGPLEKGPVRLPCPPLRDCQPPAAPAASLLVSELGPRLWAPVCPAHSARSP